ncbi:MAG: YfhO family protein [Acidobacteria bacterium]|nr:YfhO family protein [Acidobacteriota bacterium]
MPLLFVAAVVVVTFGLPVLLGYSLLPQYVEPSVFPSGLTSEHARPAPGALTIDPVGSSQILPWDKLVGHAMRQGRLPLWNPYSLTGVPLLANIQSAAFFPFQVLQDLAPSSLWSVFYVVRFLVAGVFTFLFLKRAGLDGPASATGAVCFALSGPAVLYFRLEPAFNSTVTLPVVLYGCERLHAEPSRKNLVFGAVALACLLVSGQPEVTALNVLFVVAYSAFRSWRRVRDDATLVSATMPFVMYPVGALLAMPFLLPVLEYLVQAGSAEREPFGKIALTPAIAVLQMTPYLLGGVHQHASPRADELFSWNLIGGYTGIVATYLAILAVISTTTQRLRGLRRFAMTAAVAVLLKVYGLPPSQWLAGLPILNRFLFTRYSGAVLAISIAILAAIGAQAFPRPEERRARRNALLVTALLLLLLLLPVTSMLPVFAGVTTPSAVAPLLIASSFLVMIAILAFREGRLHRQLSIAAILSVELMLLASFVLVTLPRATELFREPAFVSFLKDRQSRQHARVYSLDGFLYGNYAAAFGVYGLNVCEALIPANIRAFARRYLDPGVDPAFLDGASAFRTSGTAREALRQYKKYYDLVGVRFLVASPLSGALVQGASRSFPANKQNVAVGVAPGATVRSRLRLERQELSGIRVLMATYRRRNQGTIVLRVKDASGLELSKAERSAADLVDNEFAEFRFPPVRLAPGADVTLEWAYSGGAAGDAIAFWCEPDRRTGYELEGVSGVSGVQPYIVQQSDEGWVQIYDADARIWENPAAMPRAFFVPRVRVAGTTAEALDLLASTDLKREAVVTSGQRDLIPWGSSTNAEVRVAITEMTATKVKVLVGQARKGLLVVTDTYYPGWVAVVDGASRPMYETDGAFRGVPLEAGDREVSLEYRPRTLATGLWLCGVTILCCMAPWRRLRGRSDAAAHHTF